MRVEPDAKPMDLDEEPEGEPEPETEPDDLVEAEPEPEPEPEAEAVEEDDEAEDPEPAPAPVIRTDRWATAGTRAARVAVRSTPKSLSSDVALSVRNLTKRFGRMTAVDSADLEIKTGSFYGFVGPNGAGKTTTLAMITGLLRPDSGVVKVYGADVWRNATVAKRSLGVLPDHLRLFDRLTGAEYLHHAAGLRGLDRDTTLRRTADLVNAFGLEHSLHRFVSDYSAGMVKKIAIAAAMIHSPRLLVLDEPFESVDPVSAQQVIDILQKFTEAGGTVLMSSHSMHLIQRICDSVAIIVDGRIVGAGTLEEVVGEKSLEDRFVELAGGASAVEGMEWLHSYSD
jgi:ABC-2 type transport system ATP-binding protein